VKRLAFLFILFIFGFPCMATEHDLPVGEYIYLGQDGKGHPAFRFKIDPDGGINWKDGQPDAAGAYKRRIFQASAATQVSNSTDSLISGHWVGLLSGNDPDVSAVIDLACPGENRITGTFLWKSKVSGTNKRAMSGTFDPDTNTLTLKDDGLVATSPKTQWRFCPIDKYELKLSKDLRELSGEYWSEACSDHGTLQIHKASVDE